MATNELFERETPNYSGANFPPPRGFQDAARQLLRDSVRVGHRRQMPMTPTPKGMCKARHEPAPMVEAMSAALKRELPESDVESLLPEHAVEQAKIAEAEERNDLEMRADVMGRRNG